MFSRVPQQSSAGIEQNGPGRTHQRLTDTAGFSLIELLVAILIIGVLAAIAIPAFAAQKNKATDAQAKELARTAETTAETIATDNNGEYTKVNAAELNRYESSIRITPSTSVAYLSATTSVKSEYSLKTKAATGDEFTIAKSANGEITRSCTSPITKTGCAGGQQGSW